MNPWVSNPLAYQRQPVRAEAPEPRTTSDGVAVLRLYDPIDSYGGPWGISAKEFVQVLDELPDDTSRIELRINCPGGEVWEGLAILNALRAHPATTVAKVEGIAASAASFIAASCDELEMAPNSELMVHRAWGLALGNAEDMQKMADDLDHEDRNLASIYAAKSGGTVDEWLAIMSAETWFSAEEAVAAKLADRVGGTPADEKTKNRFDLKVFNLAGRWAPAAQASATPPSPSPHPGQEGGSMSDLTPFRNALGLTDDVSDDAIIAALGTLPEPTEEPPAPAQLPDGVVAIDAAQLEQLRADAAAGRQARDDQMQARREQLVNAAVADGRIPPARRDAWVAMLAADTGAEQTLAALEPGLVPVTAIGVNGTGDLDADDALYAELYGTEATR